jgi:hypothetical protein
VGDAAGAPGATLISAPAFRAYMVPGTPLMVWLKDGKIQDLWMGYNPRTWRQTSREILDAAAGKEREG